MTVFVPRIIVKFRVKFSLRHWLRENIWWGFFHRLFNYWRVSDIWDEIWSCKSYLLSHFFGMMILLLPGQTRITILLRRRRRCNNSCNIFFVLCFFLSRWPWPVLIILHRLLLFRLAPLLGFRIILAVIIILLNQSFIRCLFFGFPEYIWLWCLILCVITTLSTAHPGFKTIDDALFANRCFLLILILLQ